MVESKKEDYGQGSWSFINIVKASLVWCLSRLKEGLSYVLWFVLARWLNFLFAIVVLEVGRARSCSVLSSKAFV